MKRVFRRPQAAGTVRLPVRAKGRARRHLKRSGRVRVRVRVRYAPVGGEPRVRKRRVRLVLRQRPRADRRTSSR